MAPPPSPKPLQDSDRQLRTLMNHLPGMAYRTEFVDGRWNPVFVSQGIQNLLGYDPDGFMADKDRLYPEISIPGTGYGLCVKCRPPSNIADPSS
jgi:hypothetical protein